mmetsp:Transcript_48524/g.113612  ORF Transcript_48524/g.113612 Transcript_48524/m.113612 type:complete len:83 (-) Transcript_48524:1423-1671(-)
MSAGYASSPGQSHYYLHVQAAEDLPHLLMRTASGGFTKPEACGGHFLAHHANLNMLGRLPRNWGNMVSLEHERSAPTQLQWL